MEELVTHLDDESGAVVRFGPVVYVVWRAVDSQAPISHADDAVRAMVSRYGRGRNLLYVHRAPESTGMGGHSEGTREAVMKHFDRTEAYFRAAALAIEATGFAGAVVRSVTAGVMLMRRAQLKTKVFDDARLGVRWLSTMCEPSHSFDANAMIGALRSRELCRTLGFEQDYAT